MALILLEVLIVFTIQILSFTKSNCRDFIANDKWPPVHLTSIHCIITFAAVLSQAATEAKNSSRVKKDTFQMIWSALVLTTL